MDKPAGDESAAHRAGFPIGDVDGLGKPSSKIHHMEEAMKGVHFRQIHRSCVVKTKPCGDRYQRARRARPRQGAHVTSGDDGRHLGEDRVVRETLILQKNP